MSNPVPSFSLDLPDERHPLALEVDPPSASSSTSSLLPPSGSIPRSVASSIQTWWKHSSENGMATAEERLLNRLPSFIASKSTSDPTPTHANPNPLVSRVFDTTIQLYSETSSPSPSSSSSTPPPSPKTKSPASTSENIHGVEFYTAGIDGTKATTGGTVNVILHGYGAALAFFSENLEEFGEICSLGKRRGFALDWLGMGLSSRPSPKVFETPAGVKDETVEARVARAENFFVDSLEAWRVAGGFEKLVLIGHSLGGYLSIAYQLRFPSRVEQLLLISPAGIPTHPQPAPASAAAAELSPTPNSAASSAASSIKDGRNGDAPKPAFKKADAAAAPSYKKAVFEWAWEKGWSPFAAIRSLGPLAPRVATVYTTNRFRALSEDKVQDMYAYIYSMLRLKGSGEYCISSILAPGAVARLPMAARMDDIKIPVLFLFGEKDWMDPKGGYEACERMKLNGNENVETIIVEEAGHHVYLDNPTKFNAILRRALLKDVRD
ncbi:Alpha/Beta hydrolase protein [Mrakia frigida]|uniref:Alpha/Beta hydrolase protein n=1 Tax=Mrakia frigida TaxID=29902 RepID=UPI003FCC2181